MEDLREGNQKRGPEAENGTMMHKLDENGVLNKRLVHAGQFGFSLNTVAESRSFSYVWEIKYQIPVLVVITQPSPADLNKEPILDIFLHLHIRY